MQSVMGRYILENRKGIEVSRKIRALKERVALTYTSKNPNFFLWGPEKTLYYQLLKVRIVLMCGRGD